MNCLRKLARIAVVFSIIALGVYAQTSSTASEGGLEQQQVQELVRAFGAQLKQVSLLAPAELLRQQLQERYAPFVTDRLLARWLEDPKTAPGRRISSPWPDHIELESIQSFGEGYLLTAKIIFMTSVELASEAADNSGTKSVWIRVEKLDGQWQITRFEAFAPAGSSDAESALATDKNEAPSFGSVVTITGEVVCLPKNTTGPITLECALGLQAETGVYYGLQEIPQSAIRQGILRTGNRLTVTGTISRPEPDTTYDIKGMIEVDTLARANSAAKPDVAMSQAEMASWRRFAGKRFSFHYPATFTVAEAGQAQAVRAGSYIPACASGFAACAYYADETLEGTNFGSAGLGVFIRDVSSKAACETAAGNHPLTENSHRETIGGNAFFVFETGEAGMNHVARDVVYRTWQGGICFELVARIGYSNFEVYEPGTIKKFTEAQQDALRETMRKMVETFTFYVE